MTKFIAHRGFSKEEKQNTMVDFRRASESGVYGIETDVRITKDGIFIAFHDKNAARLSGKHRIIEETDFEAVQKLKIFDKQRRHRVPTFLEFLQNCKTRKKKAIVEIKSNLTNEQTERLIQIIHSEDYLPETVFISFNRKVLKHIRALLPEQPIQMLAIKYRQSDLTFLQENRFDIDISHRQLTLDRISEYHSRGIGVNCWTVNGTKKSSLLQQWGVDFITTDRARLCEKASM